MKRIIGLLAGSLLAAVVAAAAPATAGERVSPDEVKGPITWGAVKNVTNLHHLWLAGQPDRAGLEAARAAGIEVVVNLRAPSELDWDERSAAEALGMAYYNVPVTGSAFDPEAFARIEQLVAENEGKQIFVHCGSSNRVGGWLATHLVEKHGMSEEEALAVGRKAGITKEGIVARVRAFLKARQE